MKRSSALILHCLLSIDERVRTLYEGRMKRHLQQTHSHPAAREEELDNAKVFLLTAVILNKNLPESARLPIRHSQNTCSSEHVH